MALDVYTFRMDAAFASEAQDKAKALGLDFGAYLRRLIADDLARDAAPIAFGPFEEQPDGSFVSRWSNPAYGRAAVVRGCYWKTFPRTLDEGEHGVEPTQHDALEAASAALRRAP